MPVTAEELSLFAAAAPPRTIPPSIRAARLPSAPLVLAWIVAALVTLGTGPLLDAVFPHRLLDDLRLDLGTPALTSGNAVSVEPTDRSLIRRDGGVDVERPILRIRFRFEAADGRAIDAECYRAGRAPDAGEAVGVEYVATDPTIARIPGSTRSATPRIGAFVALLPVISLAWLLRVLAQRRRVRALLVHGRFELADIVEVREHPATLGPGRIEARLRTPNGDELEVDFDLARREGRALRDRAAGAGQVGLLRDPDRPRRLMLTDALLASPQRNALDRDDEEDDEELDES